MNERKDIEAELRFLRKRFRELTAPLQTMLKRRGFFIYRKQPVEFTLLPEDTTEFYKRMHSYAFRIFLRDVIKHSPEFTLEEVAKYATEEITEEYLKYLLKVGLIQKKNAKFRLLREGLVSFGETLEWYVAEILKREFEMESLWGIRAKGRSIGGDYDVLAKFEAGILYIEVKSSPPGQIEEREVQAFVERVQDLCPEMAIFLDDTHLRMKDKIVPFFEEAIKGTVFDAEVRRIKDEIFSIKDWIYISNSKPSILNNLSFLLSHFLRKKCL